MPRSAEGRSRAHRRLDEDRPLVGLRLNDEALRKRRLPTADEITTVTGNSPTILHRYCGHVSVANHAALERDGIDASTPDPAGGIIDRPDRLHEVGALLDEAGPRIEWQGLKRFGDGSFGGHTAAMHEPFCDRNSSPSPTHSARCGKQE